jgi:hypothetical protein
MDVIMLIEGIHNVEDQLKVPLFSILAHVSS